MEHTDIEPELGSAEEIAYAASAFAALGSEQRLSIVRRLVRAGPGGLATGDLGADVGVTGSVLTHHLKHLVAAGLVRQKRDGRRIMLCVDHAFIADLSEFLIAECCVDETETHFHDGYHTHG